MTADPRIEAAVARELREQDWERWSDAEVAAISRPNLEERRAVAVWLLWVAAALVALVLSAGCTRSPLELRDDEVRVHVVNLASHPVAKVRTAACGAALGGNLLPAALPPGDSLMFFMAAGCRQVRVDLDTGGNWTQQWHPVGGTLVRFRVVDPGAS